MDIGVPLPAQIRHSVGVAKQSGQLLDQMGCVLGPHQDSSAATLDQFRESPVAGLDDGNSAAERLQNIQALGFPVDTGNRKEGQSAQKLDLLIPIQDSSVVEDVLQSSRIDLLLLLP